MDRNKIIDYSSWPLGTGTGNSSSCGLETGDSRTKSPRYSFAESWWTTIIFFEMNGFVEEEVTDSHYCSGSEWYLIWANPFIRRKYENQTSKIFGFRSDYRDRAGEFFTEGSHFSFGLWGAFAGNSDQFFGSWKRGRILGYIEGPVVRTAIYMISPLQKK